jgi:hypothetical protein
VDTGQTTGIVFYVFAASSETRETCASAEGALKWVPLQRLGEFDLVEDVPLLLERVRSPAPDPFFARYWYDGQDRLQIAFAVQD